MVLTTPYTSLLIFGTRHHHFDKQRYKFIKQKVFTEIIWLCQYFQYFEGTHLGTNAFELRERSIVSIVTLFILTKLVFLDAHPKINKNEIIINKFFKRKNM